ncbi:MAG: GGDEF domain-containing protein [Acidimicrobiales bacterium]
MVEAVGSARRDLGRRSNSRYRRQEGVKSGSGGADAPGVQIQLSHGARSEVRAHTQHSLVVGVILVLLVVGAASAGNAHPQTVSVVAAGACLFVAAISVALYAAVIGARRSGSLRSVLHSIVAALSLAAIGFVATGAPGLSAVFLPTVVLPVVAAGALCTRWVHLGVAMLAVATVVTVSVWDPLSAGHLLAQIGVLTGAIVVITWITAGLARTSTELSQVRRELAELSVALDGALAATVGCAADHPGNVLRAGFTSIAKLVSANRIAVFSRNGSYGRLVCQDRWSADDPRPEDRDPRHDVNLGVSSLAQQPVLDDAIESGEIVVTGSHCAIPIGWCNDGELIMVIERRPGTGRDVSLSREVSTLVASLVTRAIARANLALGVDIERHTDQLTGLPNRRSLFERIQIEMNRSVRSELPLSLALVDLDHFGQYNANNGPAAGDAVIRSIAALIVSNLRRQDVVVRFGGEQFCLVLPDTDVTGGHHILDKLRTGGRDTTSCFGVTLSAGLTTWDGLEDASSLISRAGTALRRAKDTGRDRVVSIELASGS